MSTCKHTEDIKSCINHCYNFSAKLALLFRSLVYWLNEETYNQEVVSSNPIYLDVPDADEILRGLEAEEEALHVPRVRVGKVGERDHVTYNDLIN